ncbi:MAG: DNA recombination protein RmuC [Firmicutes bacterium]|nr:DNA recombination protein RmuC [Bacillota bacterium]
METAAESFLSESRALKDDIEETRRDLAQVKADLTHTVETCVEGLSRNVESSATKEELRFEAMRGSVENIRTGVDRQLEQLRSENSLQLERMRQTVDEKLQQSLDSRLSRSFAAVQESLEQVYKGLGEMQGLAQGVGDLKRVLGNVKKRGILGELQLKAILEQLLAPEQYLENTPVDPSSQERVEFAVRLPGDGNSPVLLPIDAKFPADAYAKVCDAAEAADPQALADARKELYYALKKDAKDIHDKYIRPPYSTDFGILFLPFEGLYAEAVSLGLMEELQSEYQVMLAGPSTMAAMLNSLQMGFKALAIRKNASQVWQVLGNVKAEFDKFAAVLEQTQNKLDQANKDLDKLIGTRTRMIQRSLSQVQSLSGGDPVAIEDELTGLPH